MADPHDDRLELSLALGAGSVARVDNRDEPLSDIGRSATSTAGFTAAVDATGTPAAWESAIAAVRPGGVVNLFGGCAEGTEITVDTHHAHYGELTLLGSYHHRPATFARALEVLSAAHRTLDRLVSYECGLSSIEDALGAMIDRRAIKVAVRPGSSARA